MNRLLVMDDEVELARFVGRVAEGEGFDAQVVTQMRDFKEGVRTWKPDVIVLDLAMPDMDGLELLRWMASENCRAHVIIMSGHDARIVEASRRIGRERGLDIGVSLIKPMNLQELQTRFQMLRRMKSENGAGRTIVRQEDLWAAFEAGHLFCHYQPKIELATGMLRGAEALVRWQHAEYGVLPPDQFISLAEDSNMIDRLTDFVITESGKQQRAWRDAGLDIQMAVNVSAFNLRDSGFVDRVADLCRTAGVDPMRMTIEITETAAMTNALEALDALTRLRLKGFRLSIDDFGTGFSSLARLRRLPVTEIKVDRSFVGEMLSSQDAFVIVKTVIALAKNMNLTSVAEGIETEPHYTALMELGCDMGQGYGIAKPMAPADLVVWNSKLNPEQMDQPAEPGPTRDSEEQKQSD